MAWLIMASANRAMIVIRSVHVCIIPPEQPAVATRRGPSMLLVNRFSRKLDAFGGHLSFDKPLPLGTNLQKLLRFDVQAMPVMAIEHGATQNSENDVRPEVVSIVELLHRVHDFFSA